MSQTLFVPPEFDMGEFIAEVPPELLKHSYYRRHIAIKHPLHFAFIYMRHALKDDDGRMSLNDLHIQMADYAMDWRDPRASTPEDPYRLAWIAPRDAGKSTWMFRILPLWAAAAGHRKFIAMFQDVGAKASNHFQNLRNELRDNDRLRYDFPELCTPSEKWAADRSDMYVSQGGHIILASGFQANSLGLNVMNKRPDLILLDDIEPMWKYDAEAARERLELLENMILPMSTRAVVNLTGTTTTQGSIVHQLVRHARGIETADWIRRHKFKAFHFPAILRDPETGYERSLWPTKWSLASLQARRHDDDFKMNMMNDPDKSSGRIWRRGDIRPLPAGWTPYYGVLSVDPSKTYGPRSDETGLAVVKTVRDEAGNVIKDAVYIESAWGVRLSSEDLKQEIHGAVARDYYITDVIVETNAAGDHFRLDELPRGVEERRHSAKRVKEDRIHRLHQDTAQGKVYQAPGLGTLEDQQFAFGPNMKLHDDILDAATAGVDHLLYGTAV